MRVLIDIGHPAHVHIFKTFTGILVSKGHEVFFTARDKEHELHLLKTYGFKYKSFGKNKKTKFGKIIGLFLFNYKLLIIAVKFKPDLFLSHGSMYAAQVAWLLKKPHISLEDSGNMEQIKLYKPFSKAIITPEFLPNDLGKTQIRYRSNHELAYLHPKYYKPDNSVFELLGIPLNRPYAILRFVSWLATHDSGQKGMSLNEKIELTNFLSSKGVSVFISSERHNLAGELKQFSIDISPEKMHDALANALIYIGEGATMASEAGVLGTPSIYISTIIRYYNTDQERFGLVYNFTNFNGVLERIDNILQMDNRVDIFKQRRATFLKEKIDFTSFLVWFIENWPKSFKIMKENPDYQYNFK